MLEEISLPWPPSANTHWRSIAEVSTKGGKGRAFSRVLISKEGRKYRARVISIFSALERSGFPVFAASDRIRVEVEAFPPLTKGGKESTKRHDLDNRLKPLLDALTLAGLWPDDSQIDDLRIFRGEQKPGGGVSVRVQKIGG